MKINSNLLEKGFVIINDVLNPEEINKIRTILIEHFSKRKNGYIYAGFGKVQPNASIMVPKLDFLFYHKKIIEYLKNTLNNKQIIFTKHADAHYNATSAWHRDSGEEVIERGYFNLKNSFESSECMVFKVALYFQDHNNIDGLSVIEGSHRKQEIDKHKNIDIKTKAGDMILFDTRLYHCGKERNFFEKVLKFFLSKVFKNNWEMIGYKLLNAVNVKNKTRLSVFFTVGIENEKTLEFCKRNADRQNKQIKSQKILKMSKKLINKLDSEGIKIYDNKN